MRIARHFTDAGQPAKCFLAMLDGLVVGAVAVKKLGDA
jgi:hypothetical protein